ERGITAQFLGPDGLDSSELAKLAGDALEGTYYTTVAAPVSNFPNAAQYATDYQAKYNGSAPSFSAQAYDAASFCSAAIVKATVDAKAKPTREQVLAALKSLPALDGITSTYKFNDKGDPDPATYYIFTANTDPAKWDANVLASKIESAPPSN
ncbi:MAG: ABC transporter substrate-binding protein, partial [Oscillochloris sp.]|nr:ABC transporter substrate-binding protein [Oscillochloris sp.]